MEEPGRCKTRVIDKRLFKKTAQFIKLKGRVADMGCVNPKSQYISKYHKKEISQVDFDFNYGTGKRKKYDTILCLEVLEHLQNPLHFMRAVKKMLNPGGTIYLSTPARFRFLWTKHHFIEMNRKHLTKWILNPLKLKIIRTKRIRINCSFWFYLTGIRPLLRIFFNHINIYEIKKRVIKISYTDIAEDNKYILKNAK